MLRVNAAERKARGRKTKDPCPGCALHKTLCICAIMPRLELRTRLSLIVHAKELKRTTNTGRLAVRALVNSELIVRGEGPINLARRISPAYRPLLLFPGSASRDLTHELIAEDSRPVQLLVPDGNWRQASKVGLRHPEIAHVERVMINEKNDALDHLRAENSEVGMSTLQAIAFALRITDGEEVFKALDVFYQAKLRATLIGRGQALRPVSPGGIVSP